MNYLTIAGNLGADPEVRFTSSGKKVSSLRVACKARGGPDITIWWRVTIWGEEHDKMISFLKKGSGVVVMGEMHKPEIFNDKEGKPQVSMNMTAHHLQFSPFGRPSSDREQGSHPAAAQPHAEPVAAMPKMSMPQGHTIDDEVPF